MLVYRIILIIAFVVALISLFGNIFSNSEMANVMENAYLSAVSISTLAEVGKIKQIVNEFIELKKSTY